MKPTTLLAGEEILSPSAAPSFAVRHSREMPAYYELALEDSQGGFANWVIPMPLKQLAKRPVLLLLLAATPPLSSLACVASGSVQLASTEPGTASSLRTEMAHGVLRLNFEGQLLRGYYRLHCLPTGGGQLWQLTPLGQA